MSNSIYVPECVLIACNEYGIEKNELMALKSENELQTLLNELNIILNENEKILFFNSILGKIPQNIQLMFDKINHVFNILIENLKSRRNKLLNEYYSNNIKNNNNDSIKYKFVFHDGLLLKTIKTFGCIKPIINIDRNIKMNNNNEPKSPKNKNINQKINDILKCAMKKKIKREQQNYNNISNNICSNNNNRNNIDSNNKNTVNIGSSKNNINRSPEGCINDRNNEMKVNINVLNQSKPVNSYASLAKKRQNSNNNINNNSNNNNSITNNISNKNGVKNVKISLNVSNNSNSNSKNCNFCKKNIETKLNQLSCKHWINCCQYCAKTIKCKYCHKQDKHRKRTRNINEYLSNLNNHKDHLKLVKILNSPNNFTDKEELFIDIFFKIDKRVQNIVDCM